MYTVFYYAAVVASLNKIASFISNEIVFICVQHTPSDSYSTTTITVAYIKQCEVRSSVNYFIRINNLTHTLSCFAQCLSLSTLQSTITLKTCGHTIIRLLNRLFFYSKIWIKLVVKYHKINKNKNKDISFISIVLQFPLLHIGESRQEEISN